MWYHFKHKSIEVGLDGYENFQEFPIYLDEKKISESK